MSKTHWKKLHNPDYIGSYSLMDTGVPVDLVVKIKSVAKRPVMDGSGKESDCIVAEMVNQKPMIINATNAKTLAKLFGSPMVEDWSSKPIALFVAKIRAFGETVDALRVRPEFPKAAIPETKLPELKPGHPKWDGAVDAIKTGKTAIEKIREQYTVTAESETLLNASIAKS